MRQQMRGFFQDDRAQDLIEYTLLIAFIVFAVVGLTSGLGASVLGITTVSNSQITAASTAVS